MAQQVALLPHSYRSSLILGSAYCLLSQLTVNMGFCISFSRFSGFQSVTCPKTCQYLASSVPRISLQFSTTLTRTKWLVKIDEWMDR